MPGETHQITPEVDADTIVSLFCLLLDLPEGWEAGGMTLAELGIDLVGAWDLWQAACEESAERTLAAEIDAELLEPAMTVTSAAAAMADQLVGGSRDDF